MIAWRITKTKYLDTAMSGLGAKGASGRWNTKGKLVVYAAATPSQAILEMLVRQVSHSFLEQHYSFLKVEFPAELTRSVDFSLLPPEWHKTYHPIPQQLGDQWLQDMESAVLEVPSAVTLLESNYLLNPLHPDFSQITISGPIPVRFDPRLAK